MSNNTFNKTCINLFFVMFLILTSYFITQSYSANSPEQFVEVNADEYYKSIQLRGKSYEFYETHRPIELNRIGFFWFANPSSVITIRFNEDFELIVDGVVQEYEAPGSLFVFRFRGLCPAPLYYRNIEGSKEIFMYGSCEEYVYTSHKRGDSIHESPLFNVSDLEDLGQTAYGFTPNDFNNNGYMDFAVSWSTSTSLESLPYAFISIYYNNKDGTFTREEVYTHAFDYEFRGAINDLDSGDFNGNGHIDLLFTYSESVPWDDLRKKTNGTVNLLFNDGMGNFCNETMIVRHCSDISDLNGRYNPVVSCFDFNNNGLIDFAIGDNSGIVELYQNMGSGEFVSAGIIHEYGRLSWGIAHGDFTGDGAIDLIISAENEDERGRGHIYLKKNRFVESNGSLYFDEGPGKIIADISAGRGACRIETIDYTGNGLLDVVAGTTHLDLFINQGDSFDRYRVGRLPERDGYEDHLHWGGMTSFDVNMNGREDLIIGGVQGVVRFLLNDFSELPPLLPVISGDSSCRKGIEYDYVIYTKDINYDDVYYSVDWGDGTGSGWIGPYRSGNEVVVSHTWNDYGAYTIRVQAKDTNDQLSQVKEFQVLLLREADSSILYPGSVLYSFFAHRLNDRINQLWSITGQIQGWGNGRVSEVDEWKYCNTFI